MIKILCGCLGVAIRLAQLRAEAMDVASEMEPSGMMTVMYRAETRFSEVLQRAVDHAAKAGVENPVCEVANYLFPHCKVIGGHNEVGTNNFHR